MSPLPLFRNIFPDSRLLEIADELRYNVRSTHIARIYETVARMIIIGKRLPLVTEIQVWMSGGVVREIAMVVKPVPEERFVEMSCADECQDGEGLDVANWGYKGE